MSITVFSDERLEQEKALLRSTMRGVCADVSPHDARVRSEQATAHLLAEPCIHKAQCVALYVSVRHEMGTHLCLEALWGKGITSLVPRCDPARQGHMNFVELRDFSALQAGCFGLLEVGPDAPIATRIPDVLIMPALAIDAQGHRLGQGGGYYDRFLMREAWKAVPRIAFVYSSQIVEAVPHASHDCTVQAIAHEGGVLWL